MGKGYAAPRDLRADTPLGQLLIALEAPDCGCEVVWARACRCEEDCDCPEVIVSPPCAHTLAADHGLALDEWAELLRAFDSPGYDGPPAPGAPTCALSKAGKLATYRERARLGLAIFHPADGCAEDMDEVAIPMARGKRQAGGVSSARRAA